MKYGIAIFPSKEIQDEANAYRKRYDPKYTLIPPHITLKPSFRMDNHTRDDIVNRLKEIANKFEPFPIKITKIRSFKPVTYTIFLKVEPCKELTLLNDKLHTDPFTDDREHPFIPHITIGQNLPEDEFSDVNESLRMKDVFLQDTVDRFQLCYELENGSWSVYETFIFGQE